MATSGNTNLLTAAVVGLTVVVAMLLFTGGSNGNRSGLFGTVVEATPIPDAVANTDPIIQPVNAITDGSVWQGADPLNLAPGEEGRGDLIAPINFGNIPQQGAVWVGPDPLNLGGNSGGSSGDSSNSNSGGGGWVNSDSDGALWDGPDPLGLGGGS